MIEFLADSGATEHLTHSKIIFKNLDESNLGVIKCANKDRLADLKTEGVGTVEIKLKDEKILEFDRVIFAKTLKENLLSLRKFVEMGLSVYLDNEKIDIFDPTSHETFLSGVYKRPFWIIELEVNKSTFDDEKKFKIYNKKCFANLAKDTLEFKRYNTRSVATNEKLLRESIRKESSTQVVDLEKMVIDEIVKENFENMKHEDENCENVSISDEKIKTKNVPYEQSNFDFTIWDGEFHNVNELPIIELSEEESSNLVFN